MLKGRYLGFARLGAMAALVGASLLVVATQVQPASSDAGGLPATFAEYAAESPWVGSHLGQLVGLAVLGMTLLYAGS